MAVNKKKEVASKVVSFRVPTQDYVKLLAQAKRSKMSISDYILLKVYDTDGELADKPTKRASKRSSAKKAPKTKAKPDKAVEAAETDEEMSEEELAELEKELEAEAEVALRVMREGAKKREG